MPHPTPITAPLLPAIHALNNAFATETSPLTPERLAHLLAVSSHARVVGEADAFMIAYRHDDAYDGGHFQWFHARLPQFFYVDRIVVAEHAQRRGLAGLLYRDLFAVARQCGIACVTCEVNIVPPNPGSAAFHQALGFRRIGAFTFDGGHKTVQYLAVDV